MSVNIPQKNESDVALELDINDMFPIDISKLRVLVIKYFGNESLELTLLDKLIEERKKTYKSNMSFRLLQQFMETHKGAKDASIKLLKSSE